MATANTLLEVCCHSETVFVTSTIYVGDVCVVTDDISGGGRVVIVWRSLTPPSKIGKGSGTVSTRDLCACNYSCRPIRLQSLNLNPLWNVIRREAKLRKSVVLYVRTNVATLLLLLELAMATFSKKQVRDAATVAVRQLGYVVCNALTDRCRIRSRVYYAGVSVNVNYSNQHESAHSNVTSRVC